MNCRNVCFLALMVVVLQACTQSGANHSADQPSVIAGPAGLVNVFMGTSGDHGQLSPAASYPFSMLSIGPQTYPSIHAGYEYKAKEFLGFTHTRMEGVGCQGSGGNILITPYLNSPEQSELIKAHETGYPGYYGVKFKNGIAAEVSVSGMSGMHKYVFPKGQKGFTIDLSFAFVDRFVGEAHHIDGNTLSGWVETKTTCSAGKYKFYYYMAFDQDVEWEETASHQLVVKLADDATDARIRIAFSSVNGEYARKKLRDVPFDTIRTEATQAWNNLLQNIEVKGTEKREKMFYSCLYRALQSPFKISEDDGYFKATDGSIQHAKAPRYNGWAIWDNYRTQLPLLSLAYSDQYQNMAASIANLYAYGKRGWATDNEASPTVRTEHAVVVLLDAIEKGYKLDLESVLDSLISENDKLSYNSPDKALESAYDNWALSGILAHLGKNELSKQYRDKALEYKEVWKKDFEDINAGDVDRMQARGLYQGTIWQYRWFVPFDMQGLQSLAGGESTYIDQLDTFFGNDYYNHANQPDLQTTKMYQPTHEPWKSQAIIHHYAVDTVVQHYFNQNRRGTGSFIGVIYKNQPDAFVRTMDDDAGTMTSWYVWASMGLFPACVGEPVYYLHLPLVSSVTMKMPGGKDFKVVVDHYSPEYAYIKEAFFNGKKLNRNWLTQEEIMNGGELRLVADKEPNTTWGNENKFATSVQDAM